MSIENSNQDKSVKSSIDAKPKDSLDAMLSEYSLPQNGHNNRNHTNSPAASSEPSVPALQKSAQKASESLSQASAEKSAGADTQKSPQPKKTKHKISRSYIPGYTLIRALGKGGMATVYAATQDSFGREVAIKIMSPDLIDKQDFAARFELEARMVAKLSHPNIVTVYDVGLVGKNYYLAMEIHPNGHLGDRIKDGLTPQEALKIAKTLASALHYAHKHSIIHRDLKPDNVLFNQHGEPVITDFGIARDNSSDTNLTQVGSTVGTPKYMSPEQAKGEKVDGRSDIYGLGVIIYEMLTGEPPFTADDPVALAIKHCKEPVPRLPLLLEEYQPLIDKLMDKNRNNRPNDGNAVIKLIDELIEQIEVQKQKPKKDSQTNNVEHVQKKQTLKDDDNTEYKTIKQSQPKKETLEQPQKELYYEVEDSMEGSLLWKKYHRSIMLSAKDFDEFERQFNKACKDIGEWHSRYKKKATQVDFVVEAHPWIHNRILGKINQNFPEEHPYGKFANHGTITIHLFDDVDQEGEKYLVRDAGKLPE